MDRINDLRALLKHDLQLLNDAEEQIVEAMPAMIEKVKNPALKRGFGATPADYRKAAWRLDQVRQMMGVDDESVTNYTGVLANIMGRGAKCKGMEGLIDEGQKIMMENLSPEAMDAAIIGGSQKIEHHEIAAYGTARTYAQQLGLTEVAQLLQQTLDEERQADELLTALAISDVNQRAEAGSSAIS